MLAVRLHTLTLLALLGLGLQGVSAAPAGTAQECYSLPFAHRVGDRWSLRIEREERRGTRPGRLRRSVAEAQVLSPYGRDLLVAVRWQGVVDDARAGDLDLPSGASPEQLDALGGGRWLLRVDVLGTAWGLLNSEEARAALARSRGAALDDAAWAAAEADLLEDWNVVYGACGVPLVPSAERVTPLGDEAGAAGQDARVLRLVRGAGLPSGADRSTPVTAWAVDARTRVRRADGQGVALERTSHTRYDLDTGRISGWRLSVRETPAARGRAPAVERVVERLAFSELATAPSPGPTLIAHR